MWAVTAERFRCRGKLGEGAKGSIRCRTIVFAGQWFWVNGQRPLCPACAVDAEQHPTMTDDELEARRDRLDHHHRRGAEYTDAIIERAAATSQ